MSWPTHFRGPWKRLNFKSVGWLALGKLQKHLYVLAVLFSVLGSACALKPSAAQNEELLNSTSQDEGGVATLDGQLEVFTSSIDIPAWIVAGLRSTSCPVQADQISVNYCETRNPDNTAGTFSLYCVENPAVLDPGSSRHIEFGFRFTPGRCAVQVLWKVVHPGLVLPQGSTVGGPSGALELSP